MTDDTDDPTPTDHPLARIASDLTETIDADGDPDDPLDAYGTAERGRGVVLAFQAANETHESATAPDTLTTRLRGAWNALRGDPPPVDTDTDEVATYDELRQLTDDVGDTLESHADDLRDELEERGESERSDPRGFQ